MQRERQPAGVLLAAILDDDGDQQDAGEAKRRPDEGNDIDGRILALAHAPPGRPDEQSGHRHQEQADPMQPAGQRQHPDDGPERRSRQHAPAERPPAAGADDAQGAGGNRQQVAEQHGRIGCLAADDGRTDEAADEGETGHEYAVTQRDANGEGGQCRRTAAGRDLGDHFVERHGGEQRAVERGDAGGGERLGDAVVARPHPLGATDQGEAEQRRQDHPHLGREITLLDRVAHQEDPRERQGNRADPQEGPRAQALLPADAERLGDNRCRRRRHDLGLRCRLGFEGRRRQRYNLGRRGDERRRQLDALRDLPPQPGKVGGQPLVLGTQTCRPSQRHDGNKGRAGGPGDPEQDQENFVHGDPAARTRSRLLGRDAGGVSNERRAVVLGDEPAFHHQAMVLLARGALDVGQNVTVAQHEVGAVGFLDPALV